MALLRRVRSLTVDDLHALDAAVRALAVERQHKHIDKGYVFAWWDGPLPNRQLQDELDDLFADVIIALAGGLTGLDVERVAAQFAPKPSMLDGITRLFLPPRPRRQVQDASIGLIDSAVAPWDPRLAVVATWNMACAVALRGHLRETTATTLEAAWRRALGELPA
jgi:hypothetical protein